MVVRELQLMQFRSLPCSSLPNKYNNVVVSNGFATTRAYSNNFILCHHILQASLASTRRGSYVNNTSLGHHTTFQPCLLRYRVFMLQTAWTLHVSLFLPVLYVYGGGYGDRHLLNNFVVIDIKLYFTHDQLILFCINEIFIIFVIHRIIIIHLLVNLNVE